MPVFHVTVAHIRAAPLAASQRLPRHQNTLSHFNHLRRLPLGQPLRPPLLPIHLRQPLTSLNKLHDIDRLLRRHDGEAHAREDPGDQRVHLVGARELQRRSAVGVREELGEKRRVDLGARVKLVGAGGADGLQERGGEERRGEGEEVEGDEEELVCGAEDEEDGLAYGVSNNTKLGKKQEGKGKGAPTLFV